MADVFVNGKLSSVGYPVMGLWTAGDTTQMLVKSFRLDVTNDFAATINGPVVFTLSVPGTSVYVAALYVPDSGGHRLGAYTTDWVELGDAGQILGVQGDSLVFSCEGALDADDPGITSGAATITVCFEELEVGFPLPVILSADPDALPTTGGATTVIHGQHFNQLLTVAIDGVPVTPTSWTATDIVLLTEAHAATASVDETVRGVVTVETVTGSVSSVPLLIFYDPALLAEVTSLSTDTIAESSTDEIVATGVNFDQFSGLDDVLGIQGVGFFLDDPGDTIPAGTPTGFVTIDHATVTATELTFTIGALPAGTYWVVPGYGPSLVWIATSSAQLTVT